MQGMLPRLSPPRAVILLLAISLTSADAQDWELVWADEFEIDGSPNPENWTYDLGGGGWGNNEKQVYTDDAANAYVEDGKLHIAAVQEVGDTRTPQYTSARLLTRERHSLQHGRVEVRVKLPSETGTWPAVWMLATDALVSPDFWPDNGEIDIVEHVGYEEDPLFLEAIGQELVKNVHSTLHTAERNGLENQGTGDSVYLPTASSEFHTYVLEWNAEELITTVDGEEVLRVRKNEDMGIPRRNPPDEIWPFWPFDQRYHLILNIAIGGNWGGIFNPDNFPSSPYGSNGIDHDGEWPQVMEVDYVRFYKPAEEVNRRHVVPGTWMPTDYRTESGFLLDRGGSGSSELNLSSIDAGDRATYLVAAAASGTFTLRAEVASARPGQQFEIHNRTTDSTFTTGVFDSTESLESWSWMELGEIDLVRGRNELTFTALQEGAAIGAMELGNESAGEWHGFPLDTLGIADTGNWLGPLDTKTEPFFFLPGGNGWIYMPAASTGAIAPTSQWLFSYGMDHLQVAGTDLSPWFFSQTLQKWLYASDPGEAKNPETAQWIFLFP